MKFDLKDMYKYLLSHTLPGLLLGIEILLAFYWFTDLPVEALVKSACNANPSLIIILGYALSTLLGFLVDGVHHFWFEDCKLTRSSKYLIVSDDKAYSISKYKNISDEFKLNAYCHFIEDDLYYPYEAFANISVVMFFGLILLILLVSIGKSCNILISNSTFYTLIVIIIIYTILLAITIYEAYETFSAYYDEDDWFVMASEIADENDANLQPSTESDSNVE
jgi:hypothetical protein